MHVRLTTPRRGRFAIGVIVALAVALAPGVVLAFGSFGSDWESAHPGSSSFANADCELCHAGSTDTWNAYGQALREEYDGLDMSAAIAAVDPSNSDVDVTGSSNAKEAAANTQPGWTYGPNNTIYDSAGTPSTGQLPPPGIGLLDPVTLVTISDGAFTPGAVTSKLGGTVQWIRAQGSTGSHNVAETHTLFRSGAPTAAAIYYNRTFSAGTFPYACETHVGMTGKIKVKPKIGAAPTGTPFTVTWATKKTNTGTHFVVEYRVESGAWKSWFSDTTSTKSVFGKGGIPVTPKTGTTYGFRVRSGTGTAWSGWSPIVSFKA